MELAFATYRKGMKKIQINFSHYATSDDLLPTIFRLNY